MSLARTRVVFFHELSHTFKRPLFWFLVGPAGPDVLGLLQRVLPDRVGRHHGRRDPGLGDLRVQLRPADAHLPPGHGLGGEVSPGFLS